LAATRSANATPTFFQSRQRPRNPTVASKVPEKNIGAVEHLTNAADAQGGISDQRYRQICAVVDQQRRTVTAFAANAETSRVDYDRYAVIGD